MSSLNRKQAAKKSPHDTRRKGKLSAPSKTESALLPPFPELELEQIHLPKSPEECSAAVAEIMDAGIAGFDTEAKPTFRKGQKSGGPHLVQFSLADKAFLFQVENKCCKQAAGKLIESHNVLKVGFGLKNDQSQIRNNLGIQLNHVIDLDQVFWKIGYLKQIGVRGAIAVQLKQSFKKSKSITTSNWADSTLSKRQILYAANDAYAALKIMEALQRENPDLLDSL